MFEEVTIGECRLILGDCREVLPLLPKHDLLLTDPPYGIAYDATHTKYLNGKNHGDADWDVEAYDPAPLLALGCRSIVWGGNCFASRLPDKPGWLSWVKIDRNGTKIRQAETEMAWTNCVNRSQAFRYMWIGAGMEGETNRVNGGTQHPTQKPVPLMQWCIGLVSGVESVLDPYCGSGTTGVACARMGLQFVGIERERKYFDIACRRIEQAYAQPRLFEDANPAAAVQGDMLLPANAEITGG